MALVERPAIALLLMAAMSLVEKLAIEWAERYPKCSFPELPAMGNLNLREVMNSEYFFS